MKKKLALILAAAVAVSAFTVSSYADEEYPEVALVIDGEEVESDQPAVIVEDRTMVPVRVIAEALGVEVDWTQETMTATFEKDGLSAALTIGEAVVSVSVAGVETEIAIDAPAALINNRTMVPVRFISELFSAEVEWDADTRTVTVTSPVLVDDETESDAAVEVEEDEASEDETDETAAEETEDEDAEASEETEEESEDETDVESDEESEDEEASEEAADEETSEETEEAEE
ncbi:MAG: copper amine oxidase N-terminal domain-containing protein [Bacteroides sp.]|nr:copper amine oxidase N-terminal domain-containing protein [Clostridiales bacterium]MCD8079249.1 copper amine oxidase N-terminal domain-containing protein [Bacteroides sp.]MCD8214603.1 copper amine oxidase N-terminal domain-containing protein [Clostridiales bacterium]